MKQQIGFNGFAPQGYIEEVNQTREKAENEVIALAKGSRKWTMCIPVQDDDSDQVLMNALRSLKELATAYEKLSSDMLRTLESLDRAGVWTGADDLVFDRIDHMILERDTSHKVLKNWQTYANYCYLCAVNGTRPDAFMDWLHRHFPEGL